MQVGQLKVYLAPDPSSEADWIVLPARAASSLASRWDSAVYMMPRERSNGPREGRVAGERLPSLPWIGGQGGKWEVWDEG
jgi:hypothetical protein